MQHPPASRLPFSFDALSPTLSPEALRLHCDEHRRFVDVVNAHIGGTALAALPHDELAKRSTDIVLACAATQAWSHDFFWSSLTATKTYPQQALHASIDASFGSMDGLEAAIRTETLKLDGHGWLWLVSDRERALRLLPAPGAGLALWQTNLLPLFTIDLWEHAYSLDYGSDRVRYAHAIFELINWNVVGARLGLFASGSG